MKPDSSTDCSWTTEISPSKKHAKSTVAGTFAPVSDVSNWLKALNAPAPQETPGEEWKSVHELQLILGLKRAATQARLIDGIKKGRVEKKLFRVTRSDGAVHHVPHYRVIA
jgi:hypothetical protein